MSAQVGFGCKCAYVDGPILRYPFWCFPGHWQRRGMFRPIETVIEMEVALMPSGRSAVEFMSPKEAGLPARLCGVLEDHGWHGSEPGGWVPVGFVEELLTRLRTQDLYYRVVSQWKRLVARRRQRRLHVLLNCLAKLGVHLPPDYGQRLSKVVL